MIVMPSVRWICSMRLSKYRYSISWRMRRGKSAVKGMPLSTGKTHFDIVSSILWWRIRLLASQTLIVAAVSRNRCLKAVNEAKRIQLQCGAHSEKRTSALPMDKAGLASYFVDLADRMLKSNGKSTMGFILPATALASPHWQKVRDLCATEYHDVIVVTIADAQIANCTFSSDTGMAECMVVATKGRGSSTGRGTFISLLHQPRSALENVAIGNGILRIDNTRIMEDTPIGGDELKIGDEVVGHLLDCPLPVGEAWQHPV